MSKCARCGCLVGVWPDDALSIKHCLAENGNNSDVIDCRNRELANLRSLLRSQTRKLEEAMGELDDIDDPYSTQRARMLIDSVLETLS